MAKYRAKAPLFLGDRYVKQGEEFSDSRVPGLNWEPLDTAAKAAVAERFGKPAEKETESVAPRGRARSPKSVAADTQA